MRNILFFFLISFLSLEASVLAPQSAYPRYCRNSSLWESAETGEYSTAIQTVDHWLASEKNESITGFFLVEKAKLLYANQQHEQALEAFVDVIDQMQINEMPITDVERDKVQELLPLYQESLLSREACQNLLEQAQAIIQKYPNYYSIEFLLAAAFANCSQFCQFFDHFAHSYKHRPNDFLAWKTRGVLHVHLFEASITEEVRLSHKNRAVQYFEKAYFLQPDDESLLLKILFLIPDDEKAPFLHKILPTLVDRSTPMRRTVCFLIIEQAIDAKALDEATQLIDKARSWYQYSRALEELSKKLITS